MLCYTFTLIVGCMFFCNVHCSNSSIRLQELTAGSEACGTEYILQQAKNLVKSTMSIYYPADLTNMPDVVRPVQKSEIYGGTQGFVWDDDVLSYQPTIVGIRRIRIFYDNQINSFQVTYILSDGTTYSAPTRGSNVGNSVSISMNKNERLVRVEGRESTSGIIQLTFTSKNSSNVPTTHGPYGGTSGTYFVIEGYILGFRGYASSIVHGLELYYLSTLMKSNDTNLRITSTYFDDNVDAIIPPVVGIKNITIRHGAAIDSIQCNYVLLDGSIYEGQQHGGNGGSPTTISFQDNEILHHIFAVSTSINSLKKLTLHTTQNNQSIVHGPYGYTNGNLTYEYSGNILGFYGYLSVYIEGIGVYTV